MMTCDRVETSDLASNDMICTQDFNALDEFFQGINFAQLDSTSTLASSTLLDDKFIYQKDLSGNMFLRAQVYKKSVKIHIRKFLISKDRTLIPTTEGICIDLQTFYRMYLKIHAFNLEYTHSSFVANNALLVLNENGRCFMQEMKSFRHIVLDYNQLQALKAEILEFAETLLNFLFTEYLPTLISMQVPMSVNNTEDNLVLQTRVIACVELDFSYNVLKKEFICEGCVENRSSQLHHLCMNLKDLEKFQRIDRNALMCIDFNNVVKNFHQQTCVIPQDFLSGLNLDTIVDVLFKTPEDL